MRKTVELLELPSHGDKRGQLVVVEGNKDIPLISKGYFISMALTLTW